MSFSLRPERRNHYRSGDHDHPGQPAGRPGRPRSRTDGRCERAVTLTWTWNGDAFQFFMIKRDGVVVGTTTAQSYIDILPDYGEYCYTVQAVYDEGQSAPAGPECVEWPNPNIFVDPNDLHGWVWVGFTVDVYTTIYNNGEGTLAYSFPEFAALDLINDPNIQHNQTGSPVQLREDIQKGDESYANTGLPGSPWRWRPG